MKGIRMRGSLFIFWLLLAILSTFWIVFSVLNDANLIFTELVYLFVLVLAIFSLFVAIISIRSMLIDVKSSLELKQEKEKHVRDFYRYQQLLDPPDADMNN